MQLSTRNQFQGAVVEMMESTVNGDVKIDISGGNIMRSNLPSRNSD